jgi:hypothetical protein
MDQLALPLDLVVCDACGTACGRPTATAAAKPGTVATWHADEHGPYDPPGPGRPHPVDSIDAAADSWPCPHCGDGPYTHRDTCAHNELHPPDCRCAWCTYGLSWASCPRPGCGRGAHTAAPSRPDVVVCTTHGHQQIATPMVEKLHALTARPQSAAQVGVA